MVKLIDIAKAAGVSKAAVSYAFSPNPEKREKLSEETREKILKTAGEFHYRPNIFGRGLSLRKSFAVALLLPQHCTRNISKHNLGMFHGVSSLLSAGVYNLLIYFGCHSRFLDDLEQRRVDGVAMISKLADPPVIGEIAGHGIPLVLLGRTYDDPANEIGSVGSDLDGFVRKTLGRFRREKVRRIRLYCRSGQSLAVDRELIRSLENRLPELGMSFDLGDLDDFQAPGSEVDAVICRSLSTPAEKFLRSDARPRAVWSGAPLHLPGVFQQYHDSFQIGMKGAELLLDMIEGRSPGKTITIRGCEPGHGKKQEKILQPDF
ncbi:MAG: LacI family DNA-binding transcriptional regulator [Lentisphaeria bacterium]|nr:LacI family DNA-binding transcriptional regulator [Lentisphaeria bacterium]